MEDALTEDAPPPPPEDEPPPPPDDEPPPPDDEPPPPPPDESGGAYDWSAYDWSQVDWSQVDWNAMPPEQQQQYAAYYSYAQQAYAAEAEAAPEAASSEPQARRPSWLQEIADESKERSPPRGEASSSSSGGGAAPAAQSARADGGWDDPWGYFRGRGGASSTSRGRGRSFSGRNSGRGFPVQPAGRGAAPPPKPSRGLKLQRCPKWAIWKCKLGQRCPFAHGDHELAPKEVRQRARREQEEGARRREELQANIADRFALPVRQREGDGADDVDGDALYRDYANPAAPEHGPPMPPPPLPPEAAAAGSVAAGQVATAGTVSLDFEHRVDGTPLQFSSRDAKMEATRQRVIEQQYADEQRSWGLAAPPSQPAAAAALAAAAAGGAPAVGRGRAFVRPAWLVRQEREAALRAQGR